NPNTKAFVSLDGTETHYFGEEDENDRFIQEIYDSKLLNPKTQNIKYLYLESGDKLNEFQPSKEYNYYSKLNTEKYYLRFKSSTHADFTCIPAILNSSQSSVEIYKDIESSTLYFFNQFLKNKDEFTQYWESLNDLNYISKKNYDISQNTETSFDISGLIIDKKNNKPLPYVNIGILNRERGTVTDTSGKFNLQLKKEFINDTIRISSIGYKPIEVIIKNIKQENEPLLFKLEEHISELNEVVITAKSFKKKTLGNKTESKFISHLFYYGQLGKETGIKININKNPTYIDEFSFNISYNRFSAKALFRLNMYTIKDGKPDKNILKDNIIIPVEAKETGRISTDLRDYDIIATEDIIVTLEWIGTEGELNETEAIQISLGLLTGGTYERQSSQGEMKKVLKGMGLGYTLEVRQ
ncbi:MAG: carboxypeptidase-like regulatory domain-containing protein, partial [Ignavibacteriae bacterium]|nr:carboxypeptidase-like regulatory domain-containing protein [Ignavibacteriota bacterium]